jgi:hypothetical protein
MDRKRRVLKSVDSEKTVLRSVPCGSNADQTSDAPLAAESSGTSPSNDDLTDLIVAAAGGLPDDTRMIFELSHRHGLESCEIAQALGVSLSAVERTKRKLIETIDRCLGPFLVARQTHRNRHGCAALCAILTGWDGRFTPFMRTRVSRHLATCLPCDWKRRQLLSGTARVTSAPEFVPAPDWLRGRILGRIALVSSRLD